MSSTGENDLPAPAHFNQENHTVEDLKVAVLKAGLAKAGIPEEAGDAVHFQIWNC